MSVIKSLTCCASRLGSNVAQYWYGHLCRGLGSTVSLTGAEGFGICVLCCKNRENCINTADTAHIVTIAVAAKLLTLSAVAQWLNAQAGTNTVIGSSLPDMEFVNMSMVSNTIQH